MKTIRLIAILLVLPLTFHAQQLTGIWSGVLTNDSTTVRKDQSYEIALTEYKGKVYGYSRSTFIVNDTLYYIVKRVKGSIEGDVCEVKDDEIISFNFPGKMDKGVKVTSTFRMNKVDSTWHLEGQWKTNKTKNYYSLTGTVALKEEKDMDLSKIFPHLQELGITKELPFLAEVKKVAPSTSIKTTKQEGIKDGDQGTTPDASTVKIKTTTVDPLSIPVDNNPTGIKTEAQQISKSIVPVARPDASYVKVNTPQEDRSVVIPTDKAVSTGIKTEQQSISRSDVAVAQPSINDVKINTPKDDRTVVIPVDKTASTGIKTEQQQSLSRPDQITAKPSASDIKVNTIPLKSDPIAKSLVRKPVDPSGAAASIEERKTESQQLVYFKSDSLVLALYDNGEIDGDTVSVLLNGELIIAKQGLKTAAIKKTIMIPQGSNDLTLILYAENLGKYPPNTGLLVIYDGDQRYQVRFSADLERNAAILLKRQSRQ